MITHCHHQSPAVKGRGQDNKAVGGKDNQKGGAGLQRGEAGHWGRVLGGGLATGRGWWEGGLDARVERADRGAARVGGVRFGQRTMADNGGLDRRSFASVHAAVDLPAATRGDGLRFHDKRTTPSSHEDSSMAVLLLSPGAANKCLTVVSTTCASRTMPPCWEDDDGRGRRHPQNSGRAAPGGARPGLKDQATRTPSPRRGHQRWA